MGTDIDTKPTSPMSTDDSDLKALEVEFTQLHDEVKRLISDRVHLENAKHVYKLADYQSRQFHQNDILTYRFH